MTDATDANATHAQDPLRVLVLAGSSREGSVNARLAALVAGQVERSGARVDLARIRDFEMPVYDGDTEADQGQPPGAGALRDRLLAAQALVIASPEYNASLPGVLKNAIDWVSRFRPQPFKDKQTLLVSASPSMVGGNRGLWALRVPLEHLGARVYPDMFSLAMAHSAFGADGELTDEGLRERLAATVDSFLALAEADVRYLSLQRRWYEFLGDESSAAVTQRAEG
ncbi:MULTISPECIES: NADPH-dependent FMN reductase [unclassified Streptomyces]|uniref:NADPH-dependent FMN reductase n=1 Tax=unclassified Streptomyces TaxID=2593676 RepID=UPI00224F1B4A|nr:MULTISPECIES: NAD(P)H-dependent oxidoreductase [unclassified Streptomyces]MCX4529387.1 NAD(P)H-dependent oxidoreductase [Streptomyces sp. NBC_01551]MCX4540073.1 NAD(P)H-dependent oxidoreductase [Streptomyces sp. NBC_01565]